MSSHEVIGNSRSNSSRLPVSDIVKTTWHSAVLETAWTAIAVAIAYVIVPIKHHLDYCDGWQFYSRPEFLLPIQFGLGAFLALPLFVCLLKKGNVYSTGRKLFLVALLVCVFFSPFVIAILDHSGGVNFTRGMRDRLEKDIDPQELQNWALKELSNHWNRINDEGVQNQILKDLPLSVKRLSASLPNMWPVIGATNEPNLEFVWGSGFGHWGILVGDKDFSPLKGEFDTSHCRFLKWRPGIYVFVRTD
jgi:hypothetical protein